MKTIKTYSQFLNESKTDSQFFQTREEIEEWLDNRGVSYYTINEDLTVDVEGSVDLRGYDFSLLQIRFGKVVGDFICNSVKLTSLKGCPRYVGDNFYCADNNITTLKGGPKTVDGSFYCSSNRQLKNLEGAPEYVAGDFVAKICNLKNLKGLPKYVGGGFYFQNNNLKSLEGLPQTTGNEIWVSDNKLTSLVFAPKKPTAFSENPCLNIYAQLGWTIQAHVKALKNLDPKPEDTIRRLKKYNPSLAKELSLEFGMESEELTDAYNTSKNVEGDFY